MSLEEVRLGRFRITRDTDTNALYVYLLDGGKVHHTDCVSEYFPLVNVDRDSWGDPVGVEICG